MAATRIPGAPSAAMVTVWGEGLGELFGGLLGGGAGDTEDIVEHLGEGGCLLLELADLLVFCAKLLDEGGDVGTPGDDGLIYFCALCRLIILDCIFSQHFAFSED